MFKRVAGSAIGRYSSAISPAGGISGNAKIGDIRFFSEDPGPDWLIGGQNMDGGSNLLGVLPVDPSIWTEWTKISSALVPSTRNQNSLIYANGVYVAAGRYFGISGTDRSKLFLRSVDGINWTNQGFDESTYDSNKAFEALRVVHDGDKFIAVASPRTLLTSIDGINWDPIEIDPYWVVVDVAVNPDTKTIVAYCYESGSNYVRLMVTKNYGLSWTQTRLSLLEAQQPYSTVKFSNGRFYTQSLSQLGSGSTQFRYYSDDDGATWTAYTTITDFGNITVDKIIYDGSRYICTIDHSSTVEREGVYVSTDFTNWSKVSTNLPVPYNVGFISYTNGIYFLFPKSANTNTECWYSHDLQNWKVIPKLNSNNSFGYVTDIIIRGDLAVLTANYISSSYPSAIAYSPYKFGISSQNLYPYTVANNPKAYLKVA
jgi:hypothetical protein